MIDVDFIFSSGVKAVQTAYSSLMRSDRTTVKNAFKAEEKEERNEWDSSGDAIFAGDAEFEHIIAKLGQCFSKDDASDLPLCKEGFLVLDML